MPKINKTKDGSLSIHIYNQEIAGITRYYAKLKGISTQRLITIILKDFFDKHLKGDDDLSIK